MTDILDWAINLPNIFLPIAEAVLTFFSTPITEALRVITGPNLVNTIIEFVLEQFGLNITVFDALLGSGLVLVLTLTLAKWFIGIVQ